MINVVKHVYSNYATFGGRADRREFWLFQLFIFIVFAIAAIFNTFGILAGVIGTVGLSSSSAAAATANGVIWFGLLTGLNVLVALFTLASIVPAVAQHARRFHDANLSAWLLLIGLIPGFGLLALYIMALLPSTPGVSRFEHEGGRSPVISIAQPQYSPKSTAQPGADLW